MKKLLVVLAALLVAADICVIYAQVIHKDHGAFLLAPESEIPQKALKASTSATGSPDEKIYIGKNMYLLNDEIDPSSTLVEMQIGREGLEGLISGALSFESLSNTVYSKFNDDFDFIFFALDNQTIYSDNIADIFGVYGINMGVSNSVQGLGQAIYSNATAWGSSGKLKSVMFFPHYSLIWWGPSLHELCHNWAADICPTYDMFGAPCGGHWGVSNAGGQLGGFKYIRTIEENCDGIVGKTKYQASMNPRKRADGSFLKPGFGGIANEGNTVPYSDIELYLMGMKSAQELRDANFRLDVYTGNSYDFTQEGLDNRYFYSTGITSYTIDDLIALQGERIPNASVSQKQFKLLTVLLKVEENETYYGEAIGHLKWFSGSYSREYYYNFNEATQGKGSLEIGRIKNSLKSNLSNDATLKNLIINKGTISPTFNSTITDYTVQVENNVESITFTATPNYAAAFATGDGIKSLHVGENAFDIIVEAENATQKTYHITVTRQPALPGSSDATLSNITVNHGALTPAFNSNVTQYVVQVDKTVENMTINVIPNHSAASVAGNGTKLLSIGKNAYDMVVTSENGSMKTYTVTVIRSTQSDADFEVVDGVLVAYHGDGGKVEIPGNLGITAIGELAFLGTQNLTSITIPTGVKTIEDGAFLGDNQYLVSISLPEGLTKIGSHAFQGSNLTSITIPSSLVEIGIRAFEGCSQIVSINVAAGNSTYSSEDGVLFDKNKTRLIRYPAGKIDANYTIPYTVRSIDPSAFDVCRNLTSVIIPNSVTVIESTAFLNCSGLQSITIPNSITRIGGAAFSGCSNLTSVTIPNSTVLIEEGAFRSCNRLLSISVEEGNLNYCSEDGILFNKTKTNLICYPAGKSNTVYTVPNTVTKIKEYAFQGQLYLTTVIIPNTVTDIGFAAFRDCKKLISITIPNSIEEIMSDCFYGCTNLFEITIPNDVSTIGDCAFGKCISLASIVIPKSVKTIQGNAFYYCDGLEIIDVSWNTPLAVEPDIFFGVDISQCKLLVPYGTKSLYKTANVWKDFGTIEEKSLVTVTGISINKPEISLLINETEQLTAVVVPENATNQNIIWSSNNEGIATVSSSGLVMALKKGIATITATTEDGGFTASCTVTVNAPIYTITISETSNGTVLANSTSAPAGETITLTVNPATGYELDAITTMPTVETSHATSLQYTFTMPASDINIHATFKKTQAQLDKEAVEAAKAAIKGETYRVAQATANDEASVRTWLAGTLNILFGQSHGGEFRTDLPSIIGNIAITAITPAIAGTEAYPDGTDGSFAFTVSLTRGETTLMATVPTGVIVAMPYTVTHTGIGNPQVNTLKAYVQNGTLYVSGLAVGKTWNVYSVAGTLIYQNVVHEDKAYINLTVRGVYIVKSGNAVVKVVY